MERQEKQVKNVKLRKFGNNIRKSIVIIVLCAIVYGLNQGYNRFIDYTNTKNYVEPYCAARYAHDVEEYKSCKDLKPTELIKKLTQEVNEKEHLEVVNLPTLKF